MASPIQIEITANFEANLESVRCFCHDMGKSDQYEKLLDELFGNIIPNLQEFPRMGADFCSLPAGSVEVRRAQEKLRGRLQENMSIRQYQSREYVILYLLKETTVSLLAIKHQRQLAYDMRKWD
ncbi:type II toxin-antitoxin system RelE/ParE family toxin [Thiothrix nivea]|uniref:Plasmid stabilization system n=1 Tax=Thiothrix nivea (strain ATCC 35100 / DSM 5205 / JP2) TaxID=870187 RepID=A0A656HCS8_THINJ|nr:type II toxin-antitoxin system RelE/ParE family toxin [Thiothrix nivea]EIJ33256.1 hypothetical protein Thini_0619 [Thiothrix nivea DSM 5205]